MGEADRVGAAVGDDYDTTEVIPDIPQSGVLVISCHTSFRKQRVEGCGDAVMEVSE